MHIYCICKKLEIRSPELYCIGLLNVGLQIAITFILIEILILFHMNQFMATTKLTFIDD